MFDHKEVLNRLLSDSCNRSDPDASGSIEYTIDLHCVRYRIYAKPIRFDMKEGYMQYDITGWVSETFR